MCSKKVKDLNKCIADNCDENDCDHINYLLNVKKYCDVVWGAYCCVTKFFARECSQSDQEAYEFAIKDEVDKIELNFCPKYPGESLNCKEVNFGK